MTTRYLNPEHIKFLDSLYDAGANMADVRPYIEKEFLVTPAVANMILLSWQNSFNKVN